MTRGLHRGHGAGGSATLQSSSPELQGGPGAVRAQRHFEGSLSEPEARIAASVVSEPSCGCLSVPPACSPVTCAQAAWCGGPWSISDSSPGSRPPCARVTPPPVRIRNASTRPFSVHPLRLRQAPFLPLSRTSSIPGVRASLHGLPNLVTKCVFTAGPATHRQHPLPLRCLLAASVHPWPGHLTWTGPSVPAGPSSALAWRVTPFRAQGPATHGTRGSQSELAVLPQAHPQPAVTECSPELHASAAVLTSERGLLCAICLPPVCRLSAVLLTLIWK